ncbi:hypothetical protein TNCV_596231 [Trichonephila clavipes]|nr:hypothetical protein TNCV_596231 [Trichonephila clavipes]
MARTYLWTVMVLWTSIRGDLVLYAMALHTITPVGTLRWNKLTNAKRSRPKPYYHVTDFSLVHWTQRLLTVKPKRLRWGATRRADPHTYDSSSLEL